MVQPNGKTKDPKMMSFNNCNVTIIHNNHYHQHTANQTAVVYDFVKTEKTIDWGHKNDKRSK